MRVLKDKEKRKQVRKELYIRFSEGGVSIPETVKQLRRILSLNQGEFAEKMGISLSALRRIEQGYNNYKLSTLMKILEQFDLKVVVRI